jgi:RNA polymerase sigma-70 factor, ECF subfamily
MSAKNVVRFVKVSFGDLGWCYRSARMKGGELSTLARQAQAGDLVARHELLVELYRSVRRHIFLMLGSGPIADDAVQETMIALYRGLASFRGDTANPRTWALTIATRTAYRLRAKEARYELVEDGTVDVGVLDGEAAAAAELTMLRRALAALTPKKRDVFVLMAIFELSAAEVGSVLDIPANTAASQYRHARAELHARFKKFDEPARPVATLTTGPVES